MVNGKGHVRVWLCILYRNVARETGTCAVSVRAQCGCCGGMCLGRQKCLLLVCVVVIIAQ